MNDGSTEATTATTAATDPGSGAGPFRIAIRLPHSRCLASPDAILRVAELADELGFWGISVEDHFVMPPYPCAEPDPVAGRSVYETLTTLAWVAGRTERVKLITGVVVLPYRHPVHLAKETATIDALSGGRLILGVGVGALRRRMSAENVNLSSNAQIASREFDAIGIHGDRGKLADEYLDALVALWTQDPASYRGDHVGFEGLDLYPRPAQDRIPIWVGGRSEKALRRAARQDGWFPSQCSVEVMRNGIAEVERFAAEAGRADPPIEFGPSNQSLVLSDEDEAREVMERLYGYYFTTRDALFEQTFTGSPDTVVRRIEAYRAAGATFVDMRPLPVSLESILAQLRLVGAEVVPALR